jgi:hypothetical protein
MRALVCALVLAFALPAGGNRCTVHCRRRAKFCKERCSANYEQLYERHECKKRCGEEYKQCHLGC